MIQRVEGTMNEEARVQRLRDLCLSLPETSETDAWGHPNLGAGKRTFATFERHKGLSSFAFRLDDSDINLLSGRKEFFASPYGRGRWLSLWADESIDWQLVEDLVLRSYRVVVLKRMLSALDRG